MVSKAEDIKNDDLKKKGTCSHFSFLPAKGARANWIRPGIRKVVQPDSKVLQVNSIQVREGLSIQEREGLAIQELGVRSIQV